MPHCAPPPRTTKVLVLHGFTMKTTAMLSLFPAKWVPADVRLVLLDQPGHGRSHKGDEGDNFKGGRCPAAPGSVHPTPYTCAGCAHGRVPRLEVCCIRRAGLP